MKRILLAFTLAASTANQGLALSCLKPDVANAFAEASASERSYVVLKGSFAFEPLPELDTPAVRTVEATFSGRLLTSAGFTKQVSAPLTITLECEASWCARLEPDTPYISFVENHNDEELIYNVSPCYGFTFSEPDQEQIKRLENCAQGGACLPAN